MDSIRIDDGIKRICINGDENRVIEFDPSDILFAERFYGLYQDMEAKRIELSDKSKAIDEAAKEKDANGIPVNIQESIQFAREVCDYMREKIDAIFGAGASQKAFGDARSINAIAQFLNGMTPYVEKARSEKLSKYAAKSARQVMR